MPWTTDKRTFLLELVMTRGMPILLVRSNRWPDETSQQDDFHVELVIAKVHLLQAIVIAVIMSTVAARHIPVMIVIGTLGAVPVVGADS